MNVTSTIGKVVSTTWSGIRRVIPSGVQCSSRNESGVKLNRSDETTGCEPSSRKAANNRYGAASLSGAGSTVTPSLNSSA